MLTISESTSNKKSNFKLIMAALGSTAIVAGATTYYLENNKSSGSHSEFLDMIPEEFSANFIYRAYSKYEPMSYVAKGRFYKSVDEFGEWNIEGAASKSDYKKDEHYNMYLTDDKYMYSTTNTTKTFCYDNLRTLGYGSLKYNILRASELDIEMVEEDILKRINKDCSTESKKIVMNTEDYGNLVLCFEKNDNNHMVTVLGKEFDFLFATTELSNDHTFTELHLDEIKRAPKCEKMNKFTTVKEIDEQYLNKIEKKSHEFNIAIDNFPFRDSRSLADHVTRNPDSPPSPPPTTRDDPNLDIAGGKSGSTPAPKPSFNLDLAGGKNPTKQPTADIFPDNFARCLWFHGAGNHKGKRKQWRDPTQMENNPDVIMENETVTRHYADQIDLVTGGLLDGYNESDLLLGYSQYQKSLIHSLPAYEDGLQYYRNDDKVSSTGILENDPAFFWHYYATEHNGSSCHLRYSGSLRYPICYDTWYPHFIQGGSEYVGGVLRAQCREGSYWWGNTSKRAYNNSNILNEAATYICGGWNCTFGIGTQKNVLFTHSFAGLVTQQLLTAGIVNKGVSGFVAMSQPPLNGSPAGTASNYICSNDWGLFDFFFKAMRSTVQKIGYCKNNLVSANDTWYPSLDWTHMHDYVTMDAYHNDYLVNYKYCGLNPLGMNGEAVFGALLWTITDVFSAWGQDTIADSLEVLMDNQNATALFLMSVIVCYKAGYCLQQKCTETGIDCSWRGCNNGNNTNCDSSTKESFQHGSWTYENDSMVNLDSCDGRFAAGDSYTTYQQTNHDDGTGANGNGMYSTRAPINWFINVVNACLSHDVNDNTVNGYTGQQWVYSQGYAAGNDHEEWVEDSNFLSYANTDTNFGLSN